jgi:hypothetical protein
MSDNDHLTGPMLSASIDEVVWLRTCIEKLEAARAVDLQVCANQLEQNTATMDMARERIEALEAALRDIALWDDSPNQVCRDIASKALAPEQAK